VIEAFATLPADEKQAAAMEAAALKDAQGERDTILGPDGAPVK
jgi:hypothetical protein